MILLSSPTWNIHTFNRSASANLILDIKIQILFSFYSIVQRLAWELEEIKHNFLENYFETASRGRKLHFTDFISWESVQAEIWYNKRGLTEVVIAEIWESDAGCISRGVDKETFVRIFKTICGVTCLS